jgi:hypothetical protein
MTTTQPAVSPPANRSAAVPVTRLNAPRAGYPIHVCLRLGTDADMPEERITSTHASSPRDSSRRSQRSQNAAYDAAASRGGCRSAHLFTRCAAHSTWCVIGKTETVLSVNAIL